MWLLLMLANSSISYAGNSLSHVFASDNSQAISAENLAYTSASVIHCSCNGTWSDYFAPIDTSDLPAGAVPVGIRITVIAARGDLDSSSEYLQFRVAGASSYETYQGGSKATRVGHTEEFNRIWCSKMVGGASWLISSSQALLTTTQG